jgi:hypothetical protein
LIPPHIHGFRLDAFRILCRHAVQEAAVLQFAEVLVIDAHTVLFLSSSHVILNWHV